MYIAIGAIIGAFSAFIFNKELINTGIFSVLLRLGYMIFLWPAFVLKAKKGMDLMYADLSSIPIKSNIKATAEELADLVATRIESNVFNYIEDNHVSIVYCSQTNSWTVTWLDGKQEIHTDLFKGLFTQAMEWSESLGEEEENGVN